MAGTSSAPVTQTSTTWKLTTDTYIDTVVASLVSRSSAITKHTVTIMNLFPFFFVV